MKQPWIHKPITDSLFILMPSFFVIAIVFIFQDYINTIEEHYSYYTWLFLIVFIDVAHVYATLFKTYLVPSEFIKKKKLLITIPIICFIIGLILFAFGSTVFWSVMAYIAVFHFIRQQYGFMRLYSRNETKTKKSIWIDNLVIYSATGYPMLYWFLSSPRKYNWFIENEFFSFNNHLLLVIADWIYAFIMVFYVFRTFYISIKNNYLNIPKNAIIVGTGLSWYFGIVFFNDDLIFTLLNVVSHGIPYMALIYFKEIDKKNNQDLGILRYLKKSRGILIYIAILLLIAYAEEYYWDILVWKDHFAIISIDFSNWHFLLVPLLTVPQFTHYILDGFIWKSK